MDQEAAEIKSYDDFMKRDQVALKLKACPPLVGLPASGGLEAKDQRHEAEVRILQPSVLNLDTWFSCL